MNHHEEALQHIQNEIWGFRILEITRKVPWGFKTDLPEITNLSVNTYLAAPVDRLYDTIILHILSGEGELRDRIEQVIDKAFDECIKLLILEHDPQSMNVLSLQGLYDEVYLKSTHESIPFQPKFYSWGRNCLITSFTFELGILPPTYNSQSIREALANVSVTRMDEGIDPLQLVYTHTSESPIDFELPEGTIFWTIGGGLAYESMQPTNINILFDKSLRQCLYCAWQYTSNEVERAKIERIWPEVKRVLSSTAHNAPGSSQWRVPQRNGVRPAAIQYQDVKTLQSVNNTVYTSTIEPICWRSLKQYNNIITSISPRDIPKLYPKGQKLMSIFKESALAHQYLDGLEGIEIGASAHNPFNIPGCIYVDYTRDLETEAKQEEVKLAGYTLVPQLTAPAWDLPFKDQTLDYVLTSHVIEHCWDVFSTLKEWLRVLRPGGIIFMIVPHKERTRDKDRERTQLQELEDRFSKQILPPPLSLTTHYSVWIEEDWKNICNFLNLYLIHLDDEDDKVGNGFTVVIKKP